MFICYLEVPINWMSRKLTWNRSYETKKYTQTFRRVIYLVWPFSILNLEFYICRTFKNAYRRFQNILYIYLSKMRRMYQKWKATWVFYRSLEYNFWNIISMFNEGCLYVLKHLARISYVFFLWVENA